MQIDWVNRNVNINLAYWFIKVKVSRFHQCPSLDSQNSVQYKMLRPLKSCSWDQVLLLLPSFWFGRQWSTRRGLVCLGAAPAVAVQSNTGTTGCVAFTACELCAWLCGGWTESRSCRLPSALSPLLLSLSLSRLVYILARARLSVYKIINPRRHVIHFSSYLVIPESQDAELWEWDIWWAVGC